MSGKRFFKEVRVADKRGATPREICEALDFDPTDWAEVWAAARIYCEDGGRRYTAEEFISAINPSTPTEVQGAYREFASSKI